MWPFKNGPGDKPADKQQDERPRTEDPKEVDRVIWERTQQRIPYFEIREAVELEQKEIKEAKKLLGTEIRAKCSAEIDDYMDCVVDRFWTILECKKAAHVMRACFLKYETPEFVDKRTKEIMKEREEAGESLMRRVERAKFNRFVTQDGWVPPPKGSYTPGPTEEETMNKKFGK
eukprot:GDKI01039971.1.p1 GENE.GDKI01039971.1~~GDKI01039971.1.p1  ORF type:complete len:174 (+),score=49.50 GDKI01039971.1:49-570(+)